MKLKIITACCEDHKRFLPELSKKIKISCDNAGVDYDHLIDTGGGPTYEKRNRLLEFIEDTDYVAFLDADDYPLEWWAADICVKLRDHDVVYGDYIIKGAGRIYYSQKFDYDEFLKNNFIPLSTIAMRGSIAKQVRFMPIYYAEDWVFMHEVYKITQDFFYIPGANIVRRIDTSFNKSNIPGYRKLRRLYRKYKVKQIIKTL